MSEFKNGDVLRHKTHTDKTVIFIGVYPKKPSLFVGEHVEDTVLSVHALSNWELKPRKEKRWIAVWGNDHIYHTHNVDKDFVKNLVEMDYTEEYADKAQYIQIEVEV